MFAPRHHSEDCKEVRASNIQKRMPKVEMESSPWTIIIRYQKGCCLGSCGRTANVNTLLGEDEKGYHFRVICFNF